MTSPVAQLPLIPPECEVARGAHVWADLSGLRWVPSAAFCVHCGRTKGA